MNIFYLDHCPKKAAQAHVDKHVVKMVLEYAQLLSTTHRILDKQPQDSDIIYAKTHENHPSAVWARHSGLAYDWLYELFCETSAEYTYRYRKQHLTYTKLKDALKKKPIGLPNIKIWIPPTPAMPDEYKVKGNVIQSYRNYYRDGKLHLATWSRRSQPEWYNTKEL